VGYQTKASNDSFAGTNARYLKDQVEKKAEDYRTKLLQDVEELRKVGVILPISISHYFFFRKAVAFSF
jgi:hypothetical protein